MKTLVILLMLFSGTISAQSINPTSTLLPREPRKQIYWDALEKLETMLTGEAPMSYKQAIFLTENAFMEDTLSYEKFQNDIYQLVRVCRAIMESREWLYEGSDKDMLIKQAAIFSMMTDTIPIIFDRKIIYLKPYTYDFDDSNGSWDWTKMFVTKLLATQKGNCHSLPSLYKILAEELGTTAYLSLAPNHMYIKLRSERDGWYNTELTSGVFPVDAWLMASGYIHLDAIVNKMYMEALNDTQSIAVVVADLAKGYEKKFGMGNGQFVLKATGLTLKYYPHYINGLLLQAHAKYQQFSRIMKQNEVDHAMEIFHLPEAKTLFDEVEQLYGQIHELGYRKMPEQMYTAWLMELMNNKEKYQNKNLFNLTNSKDSK